MLKNCRIFILIFISVFIIFLSLILFFFNFILSLKIFYKNKISVFESGFIRVFKIHISFSIHFFVIVILFVLFDLEVVMLLRILIRNTNRVLVFFYLIFFVFLGFYLEWLFGKLVWIIFKKFLCFFERCFNLFFCFIIFFQFWFSNFILGVFEYYSNYRFKRENFFFCFKNNYFSYF